MRSAAKPARREIPDSQMRPWMSRFVLWASRNGVRHVVLRSAVVGRGVVSQLACGGATTMHPETHTYWYEWGAQGRRVCRECRRLLAEAGEAGPIGGKH